MKKDSLSRIFSCLGDELPTSIYNGSIYNEEVQYEIWKSVRSFLLKIYSGKDKSELFKVKYLFTYSEYSGIITTPSIAGFDAFDNVISGEMPILAIVDYKEIEYLVSITTLSLANFRKIFIIAVNTEKMDENVHPKEFISELKKEAIEKSGYVGKVLRIVYDMETQKFLIKNIEKPKITLKDIFIKDKVDIEDFVNAIKNDSCGLRYLFVGEPGTGKTDTIKAVISECSYSNKKLTTIVVYGSCLVPLEKIFEYASIFSPVLLCIDDLDLIVGSRYKIPKFDLSTSLEIFDGFLAKEDMFIIATTNDRFLVDKAVRRPGRFDFIIEFRYLEPEFYPMLVFRETNDKKLSDIFKDETIKKQLFKIKATGAFIVTLVKYLSRERFKESKYDVNTIKATIDKLHFRFKQDEKTVDEVGFNVNDEIL